MDWLSVEGLVKKENDNEIINGLSFTMQQGERLAIMGETGSGKTSILKIIAGLLQPEYGSVFFKGKRVPGPYEKLLPGHPQIAFLSQYFELRPNFYVHEVLEYANELNEKGSFEIYELCQITHLLKRKTTQLSGGEKQRVALARLLTTLPELLLLDEPFSHLDLLHKETIKQVLEKASEKLGFSTILVSHDPTDVLTWAERVIIIQQGKMLEEGAPKELYERPNHFYSANLLGPVNIVGIELASKLSKNPLPETKTKKWMVRPESIKISKEKGLGITAKVVAVQYAGNHYKIILVASGEYLQAQSGSSQFSPGDEIFISISLADMHNIHP